MGRMLHDRGKLLRVYTQNIDSLESAAGLPTDKIVAAHGNSIRGILKYLDCISDEARAPPRRHCRPATPLPAAAAPWGASEPCRLRRAEAG